MQQYTSVSKEKLRRNRIKIKIILNREKYLRRIQNFNENLTS